MAYEKQTWADGDVITQEKLNHIEDGIANAGGDVEKVFLASATANIGENTAIFATGGALLGDASKSFGEILGDKKLLSIYAEFVEYTETIEGTTPNADVMQVTTMVDNSSKKDFVAYQNDPTVRNARAYNIYGILTMRATAEENATASPSCRAKYNIYGIVI